MIVLQHWLYNFIPRNRAGVTGLFSWLMWAFFGNDGDGIFGTEKFRDQWLHNPDPTFKAFFFWWLRNPFQNFFSYVINRPRTVIKVWRSWNEFDGWRKNYTAPIFMWQSKVMDGALNDDFRQLTIAFDPLFISWRSKRTEGHFGWKYLDGSFGAAWRARGAKIA